MPYATQDDLVPLRLTQQELVQLTDDAKTGNVDDTIVTAALEEASGKVESYCRQRYATPLQASDTVKSLTIDIAVYLLFSRRRNANIHETVRERFDDAIGMLKDISMGKASLDQPASAPTPQSGANGVVTDDTPMRFDDENIGGYV